MSGTISLIVNGERFTGWQEAAFSKSLDYICGSFSLAIPSAYPERPKINIGAECQLMIDGHKIMTGYIFEAADAISTDAHTVTFSGREKTADLVDCTHEKAFYIKRRISAVDAIKYICEPFGIDVVQGLDPARKVRELSLWSNEFGVRCGDLISKIGKHFAMLIYTNADGNLVLSKTGWEGQTADILEVGKNVKSCTLQSNDSDRHSVIVYRSFQHAILAGETTNVALASIIDPIVDRYRPLTVHAIDRGFAIDLQTYADWEQRVRAGRSRSTVCTLSSWLQSTGEPWALNTITHVNSPVQDINNAELLISGINGSISVGGGTELTLTLVPLGTYDLGIPIKLDMASTYDYLKLLDERQKKVAGPVQSSEPK
jgi:prophage tail gpP-like protein